MASRGTWSSAVLLEPLTVKGRGPTRPKWSSKILSKKIPQAAGLEGLTQGWFGREPSVKMTKGGEDGSGKIGKMDEKAF